MGINADFQAQDEKAQIHVSHADICARERAVILFLLYKAVHLVYHYTYSSSCVLFILIYPNLIEVNI